MDSLIDQDLDLIKDATYSAKPTDEIVFLFCEQEVRDALDDLFDPYVEG
jgi:hypothetical protein